MDTKTVFTTPDTRIVDLDVEGMTCAVKLAAAMFMKGRRAVGMSAPFRFPRAVAVTAAIFTLAAAAHVFAGGSLPNP